MGSLIGLFAHNWKLKLAAFALAMLLWVTVTSDQVAVRWIPVPVQLDVRDPNVELLAGPDPEEVMVRFSGPRREFWDLALNRPPLQLVLTEVQPGTQTYPLDPQQVRIPRGRMVSALDLSPTSVRLSFQRVAAAELPVTVQLRAGPDPEYALVGTPRVEPGSITVSGPAERVAEIDTVLTRPVDLSGVRGSFAERVAVDTTGLAGLRLSTGVVTVSGQVERAVSRVIEDVPVQAPAGVLVVPGVVDVQVWGAESVVRALGAETVRVVVPPESLPARLPGGGLSLALRVERLPSGVRAVIEPQQVQVLPAPQPPPAPEFRTLPAPPTDTLPDTVPGSSEPPR